MSNHIEGGVEWEPHTFIMRVDLTSHRPDRPNPINLPKDQLVDYVRQCLFASAQQIAGKMVMDGMFHAQPRNLENNLVDPHIEVTFVAMKPVGWTFARDFQPPTEDVDPIEPKALTP